MKNLQLLNFSVYIFFCMVYCESGSICNIEISEIAGTTAVIYYDSSSTVNLTCEDGSTTCATVILSSTSLNNKKSKK